MLSRLQIPPQDCVSPERLMRSLYQDQGRSQAEIGTILHVQGQTVNRWLSRLDIPLRSQADSVSLAATKYEVFPCDASPIERAYLLGLRAGDLHAQVHGRRVRVSVGTTHPAMASLFGSTFSRYGQVRRYPKYNVVSDYAWCVYVDLHSTFGFLLKKPRTVPKWMLRDEALFFAFLAGYFDAEGCISFDLRRGNETVRCVVQSCDLNILRDIYRHLKDMGFVLSLKLVSEAGVNKLSSDFWGISLGRREQVARFLDRLSLRHPEKVTKANLVKFLAANDWKEGWSVAKMIRAAIKLEVDKFKDEARQQLAAKSFTHPARSAT